MINDNRMEYCNDNGKKNIIEYRRNDIALIAILIPFLFLFINIILQIEIWLYFPSTQLYLVVKKKSKTVQMKNDLNYVKHWILSFSSSS